MPSLSDIPVEVLLDNLLPWIAVSDLPSLAATNSFFAALCNDDTFWKRKLQVDFNFSVESTARTSGWKFIYRGMARPKVFVWGEKSKGRLGLTRYPQVAVGDVPFPTQLHFPRGVRIVSLAAGGMSFHALDSDGNMYVWGTMDGTSFALQNDGFEESGKQASTPMKLILPAPTRSISCGRLHTTTLDANSNIWIFMNWGRPFRLLSPSLDLASPETTPVQVESGWSFTSVLTKSGDVLVWFPFGPTMAIPISAHHTSMNQVGRKVNISNDGSLSCETFELRSDPVRLRSLPQLPQLDYAVGDVNRKIAKIAALDGYIIGLTSEGHVLKYAVGNKDTIGRGTWEYLPNFSEVARIRQHHTFSSNQSERDEEQVEPPETVRINHISAHFQTFIAYSTGSSSVVLMGSKETTPDSEPTVLPALQNKNVISVVLGDYHFGALTSTGKLLAWGAFSRGALGLGDPVKIAAGQPGGYHNAAALQRAQTHRGPYPPSVEVPTEVRFDQAEKARKERYCFAATAGGWHTGALVIDIEPGSEESDEDFEDPTQNMPGQFPREEYQPPPGSWQPFPFGHGGPIRIGFAGRGAHRGGGAGTRRG